MQHLNEAVCLKVETMIKARNPSERVAEAAE
jgi:hypothetical protein